MQVIAVDYESYYDKEVSIKTLGVDGYIAHPKAKPYLVSMYSEDLATGKVLLLYCGPLQGAPWAQLKGVHAVSHNARFDETLHMFHLGGLIPADCIPAKWSCTADLSVWLSAPRNLLGATRQLLDVTISKGYRDVVIGKDFDLLDKAEREEVEEAGFQDAFFSFMIWKHFNRHWPENEQKLSHINREMGRRGIAVNLPLLDEAIEKVELELWKSGQSIPWDWGGNRSKTPMLRNDIAMECRKCNIPCPSSFAEDSEECQDWEEAYSKEYPWIAALKMWRQGAGFLSKLKTIRERVREDGTFPYTLKYFGAHTGRMSGDGGFNMQNMYRGERFGYNLRHFFIPRPGYRFYIADYSQIEARLLLWIVNDEAQLDLIRKGFSVYEVHAIRTMGWNPNRGSMKKMDFDQYQLAKARVLALGYGCGPVKFQIMAKSLCQLDLDAATCKQTVNDFRASNQGICRHWQRLHSSMLSATRREDRTYRLALPSGRRMEYFNVNAHDGMKAQTERGGTHYYFYGGKLCENEIQAIGRDILRDAMIECWENLPQYPMVLDVHDELIFEVPETAVLDDLVSINRAMTESSPWAEGLPLAVDGGLFDKYVKS